MSDGPVILFDGVCNFCDHAIQFILKRDRRKVFRFASLQSPAAARLLEPFGIDPQRLASVVLLSDGTAFTRSAAVLRIAARLDGLWPALKIFLIVPRPIRDWLYTVMAGNRYRWFGKKSACLLPTPEVRSRFLS